MALVQLIYMSALVTDDPALLPSILEVAVRNNQRRRVTGMLLYADGSLIQVLEGEKDAVLETFRAIELDPRHSGIFVLLEQEIADRQFADWSMGFRQLSHAELQRFPTAAHVFKSRRDAIAARVLPSQALIVLQTFAQDSTSPH